MAISWPWAIILCKYKDVPTEINTPAFYRDLFATKGKGGLCDYWSDVTRGVIDISTSSVFGWLTMSHSSAEARALQYPAGRATLFQWGLDAAATAGINLRPFQAVLVLQNFGVDHGAVQTGQVVIVRQDPTVLEFGFMCHEMGHGFGLPHSFASNPDFQYGDAWDIMSWQTSSFPFQYTFQGASGLADVGLNARNLEALGALPSSAVWHPPHPDFSVSINLSPMNHPPVANQNLLVAKIGPNDTSPARADQSVFTAEFHKVAGWDQAITQNVVTFHMVRSSDGLSFLQPTRGSSFIAGQTYTTPAPQVSFFVSQIDANANVAKLRAWDLPEGCARREDSSAPVYLIQNGTKRWITSPAVLFALGKTWANVGVVPDGALNNIPNGANINITISVIPGVIPLGHPITVTVHAAVASTQVAGTVLIDNKVVGKTNAPFTYTFNRTSKVTGVGSGSTTTWVYPAGEVQIPNSPNLPVPFGYPILP